MVIEKLLQEIVEEYDHAKVDELFELLLDSWLYFYFNEKPGKDARVSNENFVSILQIDKENPISVSLIKNESGRYGVLYTDMELAKRLSEFDCKIAKMKGRDAFDMFCRIKGMDGLYIQGEYGNILSSRDDLEKYCQIT